MNKILFAPVIYKHKKECLQGFDKRFMIDTNMHGEAKKYPLWRKSAMLFSWIKRPQNDI